MEIPYVDWTLIGPARNAVLYNLDKTNWVYTLNTSICGHVFFVCLGCSLGNELNFQRNNYVSFIFFSSPRIRRDEFALKIEFTTYFPDSRRLNIYIFVKGFITVMEVTSGKCADQLLQKIAQHKALTFFSAILAKRGNLNLDLNFDHGYNFLKK